MHTNVNSVSSQLMANQAAYAKTSYVLKQSREIMRQTHYRLWLRSREWGTLSTEPELEGLTYEAPLAIFNQSTRAVFKPT